jgi:hypothetical protein
MSQIEDFKKLNMSIQTLAPNQIILTSSLGSVFISYDSIIAHKDNLGQITLSDKWNYSKTTTKYLSQFLNGIKSSEIKAKIKDNIYFIDANL